MRSPQLGQQKIPPIYTKAEMRLLKKYAATRSMPGGRRYRAPSINKDSGKVKGSVTLILNMHWTNGVAVAERLRAKKAAVTRSREDLKTLARWLQSLENGESNQLSAE